MLALRLAMIRSGIPDRFALADPHYNPAMRNYVGTMMRAYDVPNYYQYSQQDPSMYDPTPLEHRTMEDLLQTGDPASLMAMLDQLQDRGIPHHLDPTRSIGYQLVGDEHRSDQPAGQRTFGAILPHGAMRHIAGGLHDPATYAMFHPNYLPHALTGGVLNHMLSVAQNQPPWHDWGSRFNAMRPGTTLMSRLWRAAGLAQGPYEHALDALTRQASIPNLLRMHDVAHELYNQNTAVNTRFLYPREDVSHTLLTRVLPALRASVLPGTAHLPGVGS